MTILLMVVSGVLIFGGLLLEIVIPKLKWKSCTVRSRYIKYPENDDTAEPLYYVCIEGINFHRDYVSKELFDALDGCAYINVLVRLDRKFSKLKVGYDIRLVAPVSYACKDKKYTTSQ